MKTKRIALHTLAAATLLLLALSTSACYVGAARYGGGTSVRVGFAPPALREEIVVETDRPGPDHVWIAGHYEWERSRRDYVWAPGRWVRPPRAHAHWVAPHYETRGRSSYYVSGYWHD